MIDRETVIQWALEGGLPPTHAARISDVLEYVAQRAAEAERDECAKACEHEAAASAIGHGRKAIWQAQSVGRCIDAIRARGTTKEQA